MADIEQVEFTIGKGKFISVFILGLFVGILGLIILIYQIDLPYYGLDNFIAKNILAILFVWCGASTVFYSFKELINWSPRLVISNEGITSYYYGFIAWADVQEFKDVLISTTRLGERFYTICIVAHDPQKCISSQSSERKQKKMRQCYNSYRAVIEINPQALQLDHYELREYLETNFAIFKHTAS